MKKVKLGIIGMGNMGTSHAKSFLAGKIRGMRITAVAIMYEIIPLY